MHVPTLARMLMCCSCLFLSYANFCKFLLVLFTLNGLAVVHYFAEWKQITPTNCVLVLTLQPRFRTSLQNLQRISIQNHSCVKNSTGNRMNRPLSEMLFLFTDSNTPRRLVWMKDTFLRFSNCCHWDGQKAKSLYFFGREVVDTVWWSVAAKTHLKTYSHIQQ